MTAPNINERLAAAAWRILTDDHQHSFEARRWAHLLLREHRAHSRREHVNAVFFEHRRTPVSREEKLAAYNSRIRRTTRGITPRRNPCQ